MRVHETEWQKKHTSQEYKDSLQKGLEYQDWCVSELMKIGLCVCIYSSKNFQKGKESANGIEIKAQLEHTVHGTLYIETYALDFKANCWYPSGIYNDSWLYVTGDYETIYIIPTNSLRMLDSEDKYESARANLLGCPPSKGYKLPIADAQKYAARILNP